MPTKRRQRRTADQWRTIIERFDVSDDTPAEFCRRERLSVTSFDRWHWLTRRPLWSGRR